MKLIDETQAYTHQNSHCLHTYCHLQLIQNTFICNRGKMKYVLCDEYTNEVQQFLNNNLYFEPILEIQCAKIIQTESMFFGWKKYHYPNYFLKIYKLSIKLSICKIWSELVILTGDVVI